MSEEGQKRLRDPYEFFIFLERVSNSWFDLTFQTYDSNGLSEKLKERFPPKEFFTCHEPNAILTATVPNEEKDE